MAAEIETARVDDRRRLVMPPELPPLARVTIQALDEDCWVVRRLKPSGKVKLVPIETVDHLPDDPKWERKEASLAKRLLHSLSPPES